jgi:predicted Zn-dependent protease
VRIEPKYQDGWHWLTIACGADGQLGQMALALAEEAAASSAPESGKRAKDEAQRAMGILPAGSPGWLRAQDIFNQMDRNDN